MGTLSTIYGASFITRTDFLKTEVVHFDLVNNKDQFGGSSIEEFFGSIIDSSATQIYIHDLNYISGYILDWLTRNNIPVNENKYINKKIIKDNRPLTYKMFRDDNGTVFYIKLFINNGRNLRTCEVRSSKLKTMKPLTDLYNSYELDIEHSFDLNDLSDFTIQLTSKPSKEDIDKCWFAAATTFCIIKILKKEGYNKLTIGSDAMEHWNKFEWFSNQLRVNKHWQDMPELDKDMDYKLRFAYRGGFCWVNEDYQNEEVGFGRVFDVNSLYPAMMYYNELPCGMPILTDEIPEDEDTLWIANIIIGEAVLREDGIPCLSNMASTSYKDNKKDYRSSCSSIIKNEYLKEVEQFDCWITNYDWELVQDNYKIADGNYLVKEVYTFNKCSNWFKKFIEHYYNIKKLSSGAKRELAKLMLDSLYGRFGLKLDKKITSAILKDDVLDFEDNQNCNNNTIRYLPIAIFITSMGRYHMINTAKAIGKDNIIYMDTDSIHYIGYDIPSVILEDGIDKELGHWKIEREFIRAKYMGVKTYIEDYIEDGKVKTIVKMAGAPDSVKDNITWDNFKRGSVVPGMFYTKRIPGGFVRCECDYTINQI